MPKYLCIHRSDTTLPKDKQAPSPAQMEAMYAKFNAWREEFGDKIADMGGKLSGAGKIVSADDVKDGPFAEAKELIGGFMIVETATLEEAVEVAQKSPGTAMPGSTVEVREISTP